MDPGPKKSVTFEKKPDDFDGPNGGEKKNAAETQVIKPGIQLGPGDLTKKNRRKQYATKWYPVNSWETTPTNVELPKSIHVLPGLRGGGEERKGYKKKGRRRRENRTQGSAADRRKLSAKKTFNGNINSPGPRQHGTAISSQRLVGAF